MVNSNFLKGIDKVTSKDDLRPIFQYIHFSKGFAQATDAHHLVKVPLDLYNLDDKDIENLEGFAIGAKDFKKLKVRKKDWFTIEKGILIVHRFDSDKKTIANLRLSKDIGVLPDFDKAITNNWHIEAVAEVNFNAELLSNIQNIYKHTWKETHITHLSNLKIIFSGQNKGIKIVSKNDDFVGMVMTLLMSGW